MSSACFSSLSSTSSCFTAEIFLDCVIRSCQDLLFTPSVGWTRLRTKYQRGISYVLCGATYLVVDLWDFHGFPETLPAAEADNGSTTSFSVEDI